MTTVSARLVSVPSSGLNQTRPQCKNWLRCLWEVSLRRRARLPCGGGWSSLKSVNSVPFRVPYSKILRNFSFEHFISLNQSILIHVYHLLIFTGACFQQKARSWDLISNLERIEFYFEIFIVVWWYFELPNVYFIWFQAVLLMTVREKCLLLKKVIW